MLKMQRAAQSVTLLLMCSVKHPDVMLKTQHAVNVATNYSKARMYDKSRACTSVPRLSVMVTAVGIIQLKVTSV